MTKRIMAFLLVVVLMLGIMPVGVISATAEAQNTGTLHAYLEFDERIERDYMYSVSVTDKNGTTALPVYNHTQISSVIRDEGDIVADAYRRFSTFAFDDGGVTVNIKVNRDFTSYTVMPSAKNFPSEFDAATGTIKVHLTQPEYFVIRLDGKDSTNIAVLADAPEDLTDVSLVGKNAYVIDGWYEVEGGVWTVAAPNTTIYIKEGAVLNARLDIRANNCTVIGRGAILDPFGDIDNYDDSSEAASEYVVINVYKGVDNTRIDGIHMLDARGFNIMANGSWNVGGSNPIHITNTSVKNVKILSSQLSSDGIAFNQFNENSVCEDTFIYCGDNAVICGANSTYRNVTVGTTCNSVFPQGNMENILLEGIYIFRANEGIVNQDYPWADTTPVSNFVINGLYANDVVDTGYFFAVTPIELKGETSDSVFESSNGGLTIQNVHIPKLDSVRATYFYLNTAAGNYVVNMKDLYVNGSRVSSISNSNTGGKSYHGDHSFNYSTTSAASSATFRNTHTVNYSSAFNVYIHARQVFFSNIIREGDTVYLPCDEIEKLLGVDIVPHTTVRDGVRYISNTDLVSNGMVSAQGTTAKGLYITPNNLGGNLFIKDGEELNRFSKVYNSTTRLHGYTGSDGATIYQVQKTSSGSSGISRSMIEEIKMYGEGTYTVSFYARGDASLTCELLHGWDNTESSQSSTVHAGSTWTKIEKTFTIDSSYLDMNSLFFALYSPQGGASTFEFKNLTLTKSGATPVSLEVEFEGVQLRESDNAVRFVGLVSDYKDDGLSELGFTVKIDGRAVDCGVAKVYTSILANGAPTYADPSDHSSNKKFFTFCLTDIPSWTDIEVSVYAIVDGKRVSGSETEWIFTGNDILTPGLHLADDNTVEDMMDLKDFLNG